MGHFFYVLPAIANQRPGKFFPKKVRGVSLSIKSIGTFTIIAGASSVRESAGILLSIPAVAAAATRYRRRGRGGRTGDRAIAEIPDVPLC